jgi:dynein heavy chain
MFREAQDEVYQATVAEVKAVSQHSGLIAALGNKSMKEKHWVKIWSLVEGQPPNLHSFTFNLLLQCDIAAHLDTVEEISAMATGEAQILQTITDIADMWDKTFFVVKNYRDTKDRFYITEIDDLVTQLEDH